MSQSRHEKEQALDYNVGFSDEVLQMKPKRRRKSPNRWAPGQRERLKRVLDANAAAYRAKKRLRRLTPEEREAIFNSVQAATAPGYWRGIER
jgi:hypothetical protein